MVALHGGICSYGKKRIWVRRARKVARISRYGSLLSCEARCCAERRQVSQHRHVFRRSIETASGTRFVLAIDQPIQPQHEEGTFDGCSAVGEDGQLVHRGYRSSSSTSSKARIVPSCCQWV